MSGYDDPSGDMTFREDSDTRLDAAVEALSAGGAVGAEDVAVAALFADLRTLAEQAAPAPSQALAALLAGGTAAPALAAAPVVDLRDHAARRPRPFGRAAVTGGIVTAVLLGSVGAAAAHGGLPRRAQNAVADAVDALTPFTVPHAPTAAVRGGSSAPDPAAVDRPHQASRAGAPVAVRPVAAATSRRAVRRLAVADPADASEPAEAGRAHAEATDRNGKDSGESDVRSGDTGDDSPTRPATASRQEDASPDGGSAAARRSDGSSSSGGSDGGSDSSPTAGASGDSAPSAGGDRTAESEPLHADGGSLPALVQEPVATQPESELSHSGEPVSGN